VIRLDGRVALVTGASSGLGVRFAQVLAGAGARVALAARRIERMEPLAAELGGAAWALDVSDVAAVRRVAAAVEERFGPIEILVNNAGISGQSRPETVAEADYDAVLDTNLKGAFFMAQTVARRMIALKLPGRIVNIASIAGQRPLGQLTVYGMSKAGMIAMTQSLAREWGRYGINVNAICPGYIETEMAADFLRSEAGEKFLRTLPRRRMGEARDLDALLLLLCAGAESRFINGSIVTADDGFLAM
jgi:NAD(P)-dependent dehydrogenase (short-subunit alcohol dehydrogenase family)